MHLARRLAWYGTTVALATLTAVSLMFASPATVAEAAAITGLAGAATPPLVGTSNPAGRVAVGTTATTIVEGIDAVRIQLTFPTGTTLSPEAATSTTWTFNADSGGSRLTATAAVPSGTTVMITATVGDGDYDAGTALTISAAAGAIMYPTTATATGSLTMSTIGSGGVIDTATINTFTVVGLTLSASPSSIPGDGVSTSAISVVSSGPATANGETLTISTTSGTFVAATGGISGNLWATTPVVSASAPTTILTAVTSFGTNAANAVVGLLQAPSSGEGQSVIQAFVTPPSGGSQQMAQTLVTFTGALPASGIIWSVAISPSSTVAADASASTSPLTLVVADVNGNAPEAGSAYTLTSTVGTIGSLTGIFATGSGFRTKSVSGTLTPGDAGTFVVTGEGLSGTSTLTFSSGLAVAQKSVLFSGATTEITGETRSSIGQWTHLGASTIADDAPMVSFTMKDSSANIVVGVTPLLVVTPPGAVTFGAVGVSSLGTGRSDTLITAENAVPGAVVSVTAWVGLVAGTVSFTVGGTDAQTLEVTAPNVSPVEVSRIDVVVRDAFGNIVADGTSVTGSVTNGTLAAIAVDTIGGKATFTYVSTFTEGTVLFTATAGTASATGTFDVRAGASTPSNEPLVAPPAGGLTVGAASTDDINALVELQTFHVESVWKLDVATQTFLSFFPGAAAFANTLTSISATDIVTLRSR